jgi:4-carboxymuconolactone decarboxylase
MSNESEKSLYDKGKEVRIAVLGEAHVQRSLAARQSEFAKPLQDFTTEYCWGKVWSRPELDRRSRSLVSKYCRSAVPTIRSSTCFACSAGLVISNRRHIVADLGFMIAMHSWHELSIHTKGALRNGVTEAEIREVVMQSMVYCGVPSGVQALKVCETAINAMVEGGEHQRQLKEKV